MTGGALLLEEDSTRDEDVLRTGFLYSDPSVLSGVARILDLGAQFDEYNVSISGDLADMRALASDWMIVSQDLQRVLMVETQQHRDLLSSLHQSEHFQVAQEAIWQTFSEATREVAETFAKHHEVAHRQLQELRKPTVDLKATLEQLRETVRQQLAVAQATIEQGESGEQE